jgi:hypothetical protein
MIADLVSLLSEAKSIYKCPFRNYTRYTCNIPPYKPIAGKYGKAIFSLP